MTARRYAVCLRAGAMGLAAAGLLTATAAHSQTDSGANVIEEITVVARRTEETLQEVPVTVTAIGGETLDRYQIDQVADVQSRVPALTIQVGGSGAGASVNLRGVGSSAISAAFDSAVAFDIDGVQVSSARLVQAAFFDSAQIDVLKGPQTLYFGKSATAGVFSLRSEDPTPEWEYGFDTAYEFEELGRTFSGYVSGPITETLGVRVAAYYNDINEFMEIAPESFAANQSRGQENFVGRVTFDWDAADNFGANLKINYIRNENDGANQFRDIDCGPNGVADPVIFGFGNAIIPSEADCDIDDSVFPQPDSDPVTLGGLAPPSNRARSEFDSNNGLPFGESEILFTRLKLDFDLTENLTLTSTTGYLDFESKDRDAFSFVGVGPAVPLDPTAPLAPAIGAVNGPGVGLGLGSNLATNITEQFTQEFRLYSNFSGPINFQIGAFYEGRDIIFSTAEQAFNVPLAFGTGLSGGIGFDYQREHTTETDALSLFGSIDFDVTDRLTLTAGLRWTDEEKENDIAIPFINPIIAGLDLDGDGAPNFVSSGFQSNKIEFEDDNLSPEVTATYAVSDNVNVFAAYKSGFKSGGIDNSALPGAGLAGIGNQDINPATGNTFDADATGGLIFDSETVDGGELGIKSQLLDRALRLNATLYYYVFEDLQVQQFDGVAVQFATFNAGELTTYGLDVDYTWLTPVDGLTVSGSLGFLSSEFTDTFVDVLGVDLDGRDAALAPDFAGNVAVDYYRPLGGNLRLALGGNLAYAGDQFTGNGSFQVSQDSFATVDAYISIGSLDDRWDVSLFATNLTDEQIITNSGNRPFLPPGGDDNIVTLNRGRQISLRVGFDF
ncbi:MAG: TonB-dependent receptor [Pseudomonadota bacterium]